MNLGISWYQFVKNAYMIVLTNIYMTDLVSRRRGENE